MADSFCTPPRLFAESFFFMAVSPGLFSPAVSTFVPYPMELKSAEGRQAGGQKRIEAHLRGGQGEDAWHPPQPQLCGPGTEGRRNPESPLQGSLAKCRKSKTLQAKGCRVLLFLHAASKALRSRQVTCGRSKSSGPLCFFFWSGVGFLV